MIVTTMTKEKSYNLSTTFILPMLSRPWVWYGNKLINFYLGDVNRPEYDRHILVLFEYSDDDDFIKLEQNLRNHPQYIEDYDPNSETVMFVFSIPDEFNDDYNLFKKGKYSHFSTKLKHAILGSQTSGINFEILTRSKARKERLESHLEVKIDPSAELYSAPDNSKEVFGYQ
jgi:hypothetical protein